LGECKKAAQYYEKGISLAPEDKQAKFNYSMFLLSMGDMKRGMEYYEARPWSFRGKGSEWSGSCGENVLILSEQGYGDFIHFCRFIPDIVKVSGKVALACDPKLMSLVSSFGLHEIIPLEQNLIEAAEETYPKHCRIMSIPYLMGLDIREPRVPYIKPDHRRFEFWRKWFANDVGLKVGLCWQGGKRNHAEMAFNDKKRSVNLKVLDPVLDVKGFNFYSLQKDWKEFHPRMKYPMEYCGDFLDTASLISNLDLVISVDTSVAHVAGALGTPVWMMSRLGGCWRWGNEGEETFWYPSMKVFRQKKINDWTPAVAEIKSNLESLVSKYNLI
jgi:hypothetical protein